jgi:hypothetical protein
MIIIALADTAPTSGFWQGSAAGSLITGLVAITAALLTYLGTQRNTTRQLAAQRDSWRRDQILEQIMEYLSAARVVADDAFFAGTKQAEVLVNGPRGTSEPEREYTDAELAQYSQALKADKEVEKARRDLNRHWQEFRVHVHAAMLVLGANPESEIAEKLRARTDQLYGYANNIDPTISNKQVHDRTEDCRQLRIQLQSEVAALLGEKALS